MTDIFDQVGRLLSAQTSLTTPPEQAVAKLGSPAVSVAILDNGTITSHCFSTLGYDTNTIFQAASISKSFTAMLVGRLVDLGVLTFESRLLHLLPERTFQSIGDEALLREITIKQLLSHTSGLSTPSFMGYPVSKGIEGFPDSESVIIGKTGSNTPPVRLLSFPGKEVSYSGGAYVVLQRILEIVTGKLFAELAKEHVIDPLGMSRTTFSWTPEDDNMAQAYFNAFTKSDEKYHAYPGEDAGGGMWSTPADLLKIIHALQTSLKPSPDSNGNTFLKQETARELLTEIKNGQGISWALSPEGHAFNHSGGNFPGFACHYTGFAEVFLRDGTSTYRGQIPEGCGVAVMTNSLDGQRAYYCVHQAIAYMKGWPDMGTYMGFNVPLFDPERKVYAAWEKWAGAWAEGWKINKNDDGEPRASLNGLSRELRPAALTARPYDQGKSVDLLVDGLSIMLRLCWDKETGQEVVEIWDGLTGETTLLTRA